MYLYVTSFWLSNSAHISSSFADVATLIFVMLLLYHERVKKLMKKCVNNCIIVFIMKKEMQFALVKTSPIMVSYFFVSCAYGLVMAQGGFNWIWSALCSIFIYTGAFQMVLATFFAAGASVMTVLLTCAFMSTRQIFYGLSYIDDFKKSGKKLPYMIHSLTDETYALLNSIETYPKELDKSQTQFYINLFSQVSWVLGSILGGIVGNLIPSSVSGIDFALTALFITIVVDQWKNTNDHRPALIGGICSVLFLILLGTANFLLPSLLVTSGLLVLCIKKDEVKA